MNQYLYELHSENAVNAMIYEQKVLISLHSTRYIEDNKGRVVFYLLLKRYVYEYSLESPQWADSDIP